MDTVELRCPHLKLFGLIVDGVLEVKCDRRGCCPSGAVTIHCFSLIDGKLISTKRFKRPVPKQRKAGN